MNTCCSSSYHCPVEATLDLIGGKYKSLILWHLIGKTLRFICAKRKSVFCGGICNIV